MERYLGEKGANYSRMTYRILMILYGFFTLSVVSLALQAVGEISQGRNLSGEYAPLGVKDVMALLFVAAMCGGLIYFLYWMRREMKCGGLAPRLAGFLAMSTNENVPIPVIAQILEIKPEKTVSFLKTMQKRKYIRNIELSKKEDSVRILQYHKIYVFKVYCKNCGAEYTMTSEDDYICQYCGHRVIRKNAE